MRVLVQGLYGTSLRLCNAQPARENMGIELRVISLYATGLTRGLLYYFFVCPYHYLSNSYSLYLPIVLPASLTLCSHISPTICLSICLPCFLFLYSFFLLALSLPVCQFICLLYFFYSPAYTIKNRNVMTMIIMIRTTIIQSLITKQKKFK